MLKTKRIYDEPSKADGRRILVDRLWPRGVSRDAARIDFWAKEIAPSDALRHWFKHDQEKWDEFRRRYFAELNSNPKAVLELRTYLEDTTTLLFSSREDKYNNAVALKQFIEEATQDSAKQAGRSRH